MSLIREMQEKDWERVKRIYEQGLEKGMSTFNTICPSFEEWNEGHIEECRFVAEIEGSVVGWCAISKTSTRHAYRGVVEVSIYIDEHYQGKGIGSKLMEVLCSEAEERGYWCLYSAIFSINMPSIQLHKKYGFREIGYRERIAKDRFGNWQNTILFERRF